MDTIFDSLSVEIFKKFKTYKYKFIVKQILQILLNQLNNIQMKCNLCNNNIIFKDYIEHTSHCQVFYI